MKIGLMGAMPEEIDSIHALMENVELINYGNRAYYQGKIHGIDVVLVFSRWGKVAASATATTLITKFGIDHLIFTGVAGAVLSDLNVGDIVVSDRLYQHDLDASPLLPRYEIPLTGEVFIEASPVLVDAAMCASQALVSSIQDWPGGVQPKCMKSVIASGDQFVSSMSQVDNLISGTAAVEMEGAAVAQVCADYAVSFVVIRSISDRADHSAEMDFSAFIESIAKRYAQFLVDHILKGLSTAVG